MNIKHSSETVEHGTPEEYVTAARTLMGGITLDPASSKLANTIVRARRIYTVRDNGYAKRWRGKVFLNPPGGLCEFETGRAVYRKTSKQDSCTVTGDCGMPPGHKHEGVTSSAKAWWWHLARDYQREHVSQAVFIGFTLEILQSTQTELPGGVEMPYLPLDFPCCYPSERMRFNSMLEGSLISGDQPTHANVIVYMPRRWDAAERVAFHTLFSPFGKTTWPTVRARRSM